jgi:hypothetical protein
MSKLKMVAVGFAALALASCATYKDNVPSWMPGSDAVSVKLSPSDEVPPASSDASGKGSIRVAADGSVSGSVSTTGIQGTMAHIHQAAKGSNGPVIVPLTKNGDTYSVPAGAKLNDAQMSAYKAGNLYVNVHSDKYKGGEIRGQLDPK